MKLRRIYLVLQQRDSTWGLIRADGLLELYFKMENMKLLWNISYWHRRSRVWLTVKTGWLQRLLQQPRWEVKRMENRVIRVETGEPMTSSHWSSSMFQCNTRVWVPVCVQFLHATDNHGRVCTSALPITLGGIMSSKEDDVWKYPIFCIALFMLPLKSDIPVTQLQLDTLPHYFAFFFLWVKALKITVKSTVRQPRGTVI